MIRLVRRTARLFGLVPARHGYRSPPTSVGWGGIHITAPDWPPTRPMTRIR